MIRLNDIFYLRKPEPKDIDYLYTIKNNQETSNQLGGFNTGYTLKDIENWIIYHNQKSTNLIYVIVLLETDEVIGHVGLYNIDHRISKAEFAILIGVGKYLGVGIGSICSSFMINYAQKQLNINKIYLSVLSNNKRAIALYKKLGFSIEGELKRDQYKNGEYLNSILMAKFK